MLTTARRQPNPDMWRIAKNKWNRGGEPWRDAIAIEDIGDPLLAVPPIVCWMARGEDQRQNAELIVAAVNAVKMAATPFSETQLGDSYRTELARP